MGKDAAITGSVYVVVVEENGILRHRGRKIESTASIVYHQYACYGLKGVRGSFNFKGEL